MTRPAPAELAAVGAPVHYTPDEAAALLDPTGTMTGHWLLVRARRKEVPHVKAGRAIVFNPVNLAEIAKTLGVSAKPKPAAVPAQRAPQKKKAADAPGAVPRLRSKRLNRKDPAA